DEPAALSAVAPRMAPGRLSGGGESVGKRILSAVEPVVDRGEHWPDLRRGPGRAGMSSYVGRHAELYDLFYADKPYEAEAAFVHDRLQALGDGPTNKLLEIACGTGRHALQLAKRGYHVIAVDYSSDMIDVAQRNGAADSTTTIDFRCQDMRALDVPERPFDAV